MRKIYDNISLGQLTRFDEYEWNYLRYEIMKVFGRKHLRVIFRVGIMNLK